MTKTWFITGASRGFGREWSIAALERGDSVAATARDTSTLDDLAKSYGERLLPIALDVNDRAADFAAVQQAHEHFGRLDVVVNNAGYGQFGMIEEISEDEARAQLETNLFGALWVTQAALPYLRAQGSGHILQVSSIGGISAFQNVGMYHASKWALEGFSQALAQEVAAFGIKVTLIEPGGFSTDWGGSSAKHATKLADYAGVREAAAQARKTRMSAPGNPNASASAVLKIVDAENPPLRVFFGEAPLAIATKDYESRLAEWNTWQPVSLEAQGSLTSMAADTDSTTAEGVFERDQNYLTARITADGRDGYPVEAGRYRLVVARACPWANRATIVRRLLGLEGAISQGICGPTHDERSWTFDLDPGGVDPVLRIERLQQAFFARDPDYPRGITVPAFVDIASGAVVTNDYAQMTIDMSLEWTEFHRDGAPELYPEALRDEIDEVAQLVFADVNNGVYRCGFATSQDAYERAYGELFARLDWLEDRLADRRYLVGDTITEADVRLFTTLARLDAVYHGHFKANRQKLIEFPALWAYARDLFQTPGFGDTTDFVQIKQHYYGVHKNLNPSGIVPAGPDPAGWLVPHGRESLGGRPFGDGTPPGPVAAGEQVAPEHGAAIPG